MTPRFACLKWSLLVVIIWLLDLFQLLFKKMCLQILSFMSSNRVKKALECCFMMLSYLTFSFDMDMQENLLFYRNIFSVYPNLYKYFCCQCSTYKILLYVMKLDNQNWELFPGDGGQSIHITTL